MPPVSAKTAAFVDDIGRAAALGDPARIGAEVKSLLQELVAGELEGIPAAFFVGEPDRYARRLLHQCPEKSFSILVMVWQPGQSTPIHDHGGNWCVECVLKGTIEVVGYDPVGDPAGICGFTETKRAHALPGDVGVLVPPNEYHTIANASTGEAVTIHVYEGEMLWCHTFEEIADGQYGRAQCDLDYTD